MLLFELIEMCNELTCFCYVNLNNISVTVRAALCVPAQGLFRDADRGLYGVCGEHHPYFHPTGELIWRLLDVLLGKQQQVDQI